MHSKFTITTITHGSDKYEQLLQLRIEVLLKPIGVDSSFIQPQQEKNDTFIGAFDGKKLVGCCVLTARNSDTMQLRQMAVETRLQGQGLGAAIVQFAEQVTKEKGFGTMLLHARSPVVAFYEKSGYRITGEPFEEVGILHYRMEKKI
jgi:predicted GNAT family N-acyltransferase